jgi:hypothetical protein
MYKPFLRVLICGDRSWTNRGIIKEAVLKVLQTNDIEYIIEGGANGADRLGRSVAEEIGIPVDTYYAKWQMYGKAAGRIRNKEMLNKGKPTLVLAFHNNIQNSKGTKNMIEIAVKAGVKVLLHTEYIETEILRSNND